MLVLLLKNYLLRILSSVRHGTWQKRSIAILISIGWTLFLFYIFHLFFDLFSTILSSNETGEIQVRAILTIMLFSILLILFFSGITISLHFYYVSSDFPLLLGLPISHEIIFQYKFWEILIANSTLYWYSGFPILLAYGVAMHAHFTYYPLVPVISALFLVVPTGMALLVVLPLAKIAPPNRAREFSGLILALILIMTWTALQFLRTSIFTENPGVFDSDKLSQFIQIANNDILQWLPSGWIANILHGFATGQHQDALLVLVILIIFSFLLALLTTQIMTIGYNHDLAGGEFMTTFWRKIPPKALAKTELKFAAPGSFIFAIFQRDLRLIFRDTRQLSQLVMFVVIMIVMPLVVHKESNDATDILFYLPYFYFLFFAILTTMHIGARLIPLEGRAFWLILSCPQNLQNLILGKFYLGLLVIGLCISVTVIVLGLIQHYSIVIIAILWLIAISTCCGAAGLAQVLGATFPRFDWEHPKRMLTGGGGLTLVIYAIIYTFVIIGGAAVIYKVLFDLYGKFNIAIYAMLLFVILFASFVTVSSLLYAAQRLEKYEWLL